MTPLGHGRTTADPRTQTSRSTFGRPPSARVWAAAYRRRRGTALAWSDAMDITEKNPEEPSGRPLARRPVGGRGLCSRRVRVGARRNGANRGRLSAARAARAARRRARRSRTTTRRSVPPSARPLAARAVPTPETNSPATRTTAMTKASSSSRTVTFAGYGTRVATFGSHMKHTSTRTALRLAAAFAALFAPSLAGIGCDSNGGDDMGRHERRHVRAGHRTPHHRTGPRGRGTDAVVESPGNPGPPPRRDCRRLGRFRGVRLRVGRNGRRPLCPVDSRTNLAAHERPRRRRCRFHRLAHGQGPAGGGPHARDLRQRRPRPQAGGGVPRLPRRLGGPRRPRHADANPPRPRHRVRHALRRLRLRRRERRRAAHVLSQQRRHHGRRPGMHA